MVLIGRDRCSGILESLQIIHIKYWEFNTPSKSILPRLCAFYMKMNIYPCVLISGNGNRESPFQYEGCASTLPSAACIDMPRSQSQRFFYNQELV
jgi:hypothetical protein